MLKLIQGSYCLFDRVALCPRNIVSLIYVTPVIVVHGLSLIIILSPDLLKMVSADSALIFTPPVTHLTSIPRHHQAGYGMPSNSSLRLDEAMASEMANLR